MATATINARSVPALPPGLRIVPPSRLETRAVQGIVLAGSFPWSDSPLDRLLPRPLLPVAHQPLISYTLRWLRASGVRDVVVCLNRASRAARGPIAEISDAAGLEFYEDAAPRGPAGCARDAALLGDADTFVVAEGTGIPTTSLADLMEAHRTSGALATVVVQEEKPGEGNPCLSRPGGLYVFERRALEQVARKGFQDIKENLIPRLYRAGEHVAAHRIGARSARVHGTGTYLDVNHYAVLRMLRRPEPPAGYDRRGDALVHRSASVDPDVGALQFAGAAFLSFRTSGGAISVIGSSFSASGWFILASPCCSGKETSTPSGITGVAYSVAGGGDTGSTAICASTLFSRAGILAVRIGAGCAGPSVESELISVTLRRFPIFPSTEVPKRI